jgi:hypothetical protein
LEKLRNAHVKYEKAMENASRYGINTKYECDLKCAKTCFSNPEYLTVHESYKCFFSKCKCSTPNNNTDDSSPTPTIFAELSQIFDQELNLKENLNESETLG